MIELGNLPRIAPVTTVVLAAYLLLAVATGPFEPDFDKLLQLGACMPMLVADYEVWRLLTHAFLHGGIVHLAFNTYALFAIGPQLEVALGPVRFALLYVTGAIAGGVAGSLWHSPVTHLVGGSGALFGMLGAALSIQMRYGRTWTDFLEQQSGRSLLTMVGVNLLLGLLIPVVSNAAHVGGLIGGFVATFCFLDRGRHAADRTARWIQAGWIALLASLVLWAMFPFPRMDALAWARERSRDLAVKFDYELALTYSGRLGLTEQRERNDVESEIAARRR